MSRRNARSSRLRDPRAQIHLPPLSPEQALLISNLLDRAIAALWRSHGHAIAELLASLDSGPEPPADSSAAPSADDDLF